MKKLILILILLNIILIPNAFSANTFSESKKGHINLLAVREMPDGSLEGGVADLFLEIREGEGRVFLETFPLTKTDTQMSTRFAKAIACDYAEVDCSKYDFFYTITADAPIIAGPSAGSSISALTVALLMDKEADKGVVATGTINSGGLVGPVGGLKAKIMAAAETGHTKVLIPDGESIGREENETINITEFSKELGIEIIETSTIKDVVEEFTGFRKKGQELDIDINEEYSSRMKGLSVQLCGRSDKLKEEIEKKRATNDDSNDNSNLSINLSITDEIINLTTRGKNSFDNREYYSSASYCFGANVLLNIIVLQKENLSKEEILKEVNELKEGIRKFEEEIDSREKKTITDLETYMVVKERLIEAGEIADDALNELNSTNSTINSVRALAYSIERFNSAKSWAIFFGSNGKEFNLNKEVLRKACRDKLAEVEERIQYAELYLPGSLDGVEEENGKAYKDLENGNYELCLFKASEAKASVDVILGAFGVGEEQFAGFLERKLEIVRDNLAEQTSKGIFPIIGYSYYEYANSLKETNTMSGMLYSEYALELGNLDIYFQSEKPEKAMIRKKIDVKMIIVLLIGIVIGAFARVLVGKKRK